MKIGKKKTIAGKRQHGNIFCGRVLLGNKFSLFLCSSMFLTTFMLENMYVKIILLGGILMSSIAFFYYYCCCLWSIQIMKKIYNMDYYNPTSLGNENGINKIKFNVEIKKAEIKNCAYMFLWISDWQWRRLSSWTWGWCKA
jgi:hypothetical protein